MTQLCQNFPCHLGMRQLAALTDRIDLLKAEVQAGKLKRTRAQRHLPPTSRGTWRRLPAGSARSWGRCLMPCAIYNFPPVCVAFVASSVNPFRHNAAARPAANMLLRHISRRQIAASAGAEVNNPSAALPTQLAVGAACRLPPAAAQCATARQLLSPCRAAVQTWIPWRRRFMSWSGGRPCCMMWTPPKPSSCSGAGFVGQVLLVTPSCAPAFLAAWSKGNRGTCSAHPWLNPTSNKTTAQPQRACPSRSFPNYGYGRAAGGAGRRIDDLYAAEIAPRLGSEHYLDFTGSGLYFNSQIAGLAQVCGPTGAGAAAEISKMCCMVGLKQARPLCPCHTMQAGQHRRCCMQP